jgi:hypothetical protein
MALYLFAALGIFLLAVPWSPVWEFGTSFLLPSSMATWVRSGWTRGTISGLGALNLLAAGQEAGRLWRAMRHARRGNAP